MSVVAWKDAYSLGMPEIDDQHKVLFELINELWDAIVKRASAENQMLVIEGLERYTIAHFTAEETYMREVRYAKFDAHKQMHDQFIQRIAQEKNRLLSGHGFSLDVLHFLKDWLVDHIVMQLLDSLKYRA